MLLLYGLLLLLLYGLPLLLPVLLLLLPLLLLLDLLVLPGGCLPGGCMLQCAAIRKLQGPILDMLYRTLSQQFARGVCACSDVIKPVLMASLYKLFVTVNRLRYL
jgi:hypothetical protein